MTSPSRSCATCQWSQPAFVSETGEEVMPVLECHRNPPVVVSVEVGLMRIFPQVDGEDWCGEHHFSRPRRVIAPDRGRQISEVDL